MKRTKYIHIVGNYFLTRKFKKVQKEGLNTNELSAKTYRYPICKTGPCNNIALYAITSSVEFHCRCEMLQAMLFLCILPLMQCSLTTEWFLLYSILFYSAECHSMPQPAIYTYVNNILKNANKTVNDLVHSALN